MADDIVTRLREEICHMPECCWLFTDSADEIERLRKEVNVWRSICERFAESDPRFDAFHIYFKAVRGG